MQRWLTRRLHVSTNALLGSTCTVLLAAALLGRFPDETPALAQEAPGPPSTSAATQTPSLPDSVLGAAVADYMARLEAFGFSGVVLVGRGDEVIHVSAHGVADREAPRPFTSGTVVALGSITKVYTAAAILRLVDRGELALTDTLGAFVPDLPSDQAAVTLAQLLTHSSGFGELSHSDEDEVSRNQMLEETGRLSLLDQPGASVSYSNLGFSLLAVILEDVTGLTYEEALRREVLVPARAWETGYTRAGWGPERVAAGYIQGRRWGTIVEHFPGGSGPSWTLMGNGGLHTTVFDAFRFVRAFTRGEIVSPELTAASMEPFGGRFPARGLGWERYTAPDDTRAVGHDGSNNFLTASVRYLRDHDITLVAAANQTEFTAIDIMPPLLRLVTGLETPLPPKIDPEPLDDGGRRALLGLWEVGGGRIRVVDGGDHVQIHVEGQTLLDRVLAVTPEVRARLDDDTERAQRIVTAAGEGDFSGAPILQRVWNALEDQFGPIEHAEVLGSAPVWYSSPRASWLRLRFRGSDRTAIRRLHWSADGAFYGVGGTVYPAPVSLRCVGTGPQTCTATHLVLPVGSLHMSVLGDERAEIRIDGAVLEAHRAGDSR